jgi:glyoxylase-like metal-dependent hydrolase (beta-lactamase superfamily II)
MLKSLCIYILVLFLVSACSGDDLPLLEIKNYPDRREDFSLWQLEQFFGEPQMGYLIRTDDQKLVIIDGGVIKSAPLIKNYINQLGGEVDTWILTHPHQDHAGALSVLLRDKSIRINKVFQTTLDVELVAKHEAVALPFLKEYNEALTASGVPLLNLQNGEIYSIGDGISLEVIGARNNHILINHVNNSSLVFRIKSKNKSILFLGDLGIEGGNEILGRVSAEDLRADYVQMSHHGQDGVSKEFYQAVAARFALWPTPMWLWENNLYARGFNTGTWKILNVQAWMTELQVEFNYVAGIEGTLQID